MSDQSFLTHIHPDQFRYDLPEDRIAKYPLENRADSRLLLYKDGKIHHKIFKEINDHIPQDSLLIFNDTRVIQARLIFYRASGARIEVFLLEPVSPHTDMAQAMAVKKSTTWKCMIGNARKWKQGESLQLVLSDKIILTATRVLENHVRFDWECDLIWSEIIEKAGKLPLPPYLHREAEAEDLPRYQTVYSAYDGAVAAPTAGLHFTPAILEQLKKNHTLGYVTLHVSAGTFQPITTDAAGHQMHREQVVVNRTTIIQLLNHDFTIAVGTTSMRTIESIYWFGSRLMQGNTVFEIAKDEPYRTTLPVRKAQALMAILDYMDQHQLNELSGYTEIMIVPGYTFKLTNGLITNFHLPGTTLMMLIAAFVGANWEKIYKDALSQGYRFLSYGDSSLLFR